jgi:squalene-hopene/tetraprenyl-beta-curcumene cyclase
MRATPASEPPNMRRLVLVCVALLTAMAGAAPLRAQGPDFKSLVDDATVELGRRQRPDGSYDADVVTTADAILAFAEAPRRYAEVDGPFFRKAILWLAAQVGSDGRPATKGDVHEQVALAGWLDQALAHSKSAEAKAARERLARFLASDEVKQRGEAKMPEAEFLRTWRIPGKTVEEIRPTIDQVTSRLMSEPQMNRPEFDRWLDVMPPILADLAARFPELKLPTRVGGDQHWTKVLGSVVAGALHAPAGFEEASSRHLAAAARALTICHEKAPKEAGGGGPPKPTGTPRTVGADLKASYAEAAKASLAWLEQQQKDGRFGFMGRDDPGISALALAAVLRTSKRLGAPPPAWCDRGLDWLVSLQKPNGSIHSGALAVYVTSAAMLALTDAGREKDKPALEKATVFLKVVQRDEAEGYDPSLDWGYGGIGYSDELRPDLSNTQFGIEAMAAAGVKPSDEAMQRAILFLQRCQNNPEFNARPIERADGRLVKAGNDGGAGYYPGESKAGLADRGDGTFSPRSYGSMTYALLKCYLFAGLPLTDPRVAAALGWIQANWTVDANPGFDPKASPGAEYQGLYYYYFTMAKALDRSGLDVLATPDGVKHAWRDELLRKLLESSMVEGFWTNQKSARWMEEFPVLATSYALVAMDHCLPPSK